MAGMMTVTMMCACGQGQQKAETAVDSVSVNDFRYAPATDYQSVDTTTAVPVPTEAAPTTQAQPQTAAPSYSETKLSRFYEEGYENGYDDGEEDAYTNSGWQATFDDECGYRGWKREEYEDGYLDGYEAGYDDNFEGGEE